MNNTILPFDFNMPYKTYGDLGFMSGIMMAHSNSAYNWIYCNFIDLFWDGKFGVYNRSMEFFCEGPIIIDYSTFYSSDLFDNPELVIDRITKWIDDGYYIHSYYNEIAIPAKNAYLISDNKHDYYMYGYDNGKKVFYLLGYTKRRICESFTVSYSDFINSLVKLESDSIDVELIKYNRHFKYNFTSNDYYSKIVRSIKRFLYSYNPMNMFDKLRLHGIEAEKEYINYLQKIYDCNENIDMRNCRLLMENKNIWFCIYEKIIKEKEYSIKVDKELLLNYSSQHFLSLKYNITKEKKILDNLIRKLNDTFLREEELVKKLLFAMNKENYL